ncbi:MAG: sigma-E factor negative regulatory protein [Pseudomonadota bacterium]
MKKLKSIPNEHISDFVDGHLPDEECAQALDDLLSDPQAMKTWHAYHVVGDVLRSAELAPSNRDLAFLEKLERRLAQEQPARPPVLEDGSASFDSSVPSANASVFRWKMLAGMACTALIGVIGLSLWTQTSQDGRAQMAVQVPAAPPAPSLVTSDTGAGPMLRDARLDELMAAHRQLGGHSALQVPAGFLRNATHEGNAR